MEATPGGPQSGRQVDRSRGSQGCAHMCDLAGLFLPIPGASSLEDCQPCPAGWFCSRAGLSSPEALCEGGWFCPGASVSGHSPGKGTWGCWRLPEATMEGRNA